MELIKPYKNAECTSREEVIELLKLGCDDTSELDVDVFFNMMQNANNINEHLSDIIEDIYELRTNVFAIFYKIHPEIFTELTTDNLGHLYNYFVDSILTNTVDKFYYVKDKATAIESKFTWKENESPNIGLLNTLTDSDIDILKQNAPFDVKLIAPKQLLNKIQDGTKLNKEEIKDNLQYTEEEAEVMTQNFIEAGQIKEKNAAAIIELCNLVLKKLPNIYLFDITPYSNTEVIRLKGWVIQDLMDFFRETIHKARGFVKPEEQYTRVTRDKLIP